MRPTPIIFTHDALDYYLYTNLYIVLLVLFPLDSYFLSVLRLRVRTLILGLELPPKFICSVNESLTTKTMTDRTRIFTRI